MNLVFISMGLGVCLKSYISLHALLDWCVMLQAYHISTDFKDSIFCLIFDTTLFILLMLLCHFLSQSLTQFKARKKPIKTLDH